MLSLLMNAFITYFVSLQQVFLMVYFHTLDFIALYIVYTQMIINNFTTAWCIYYIFIFMLNSKFVCFQDILYYYLSEPLAQIYLSTFIFLLMYRWYLLFLNDGNICRWYPDFFWAFSNKLQSWLQFKYCHCWFVLPVFFPEEETKIWIE